MELDLLLRESVVLLGSAVAVLLLASRLRVPPIIALLLTGLLIGPSGLAWVADPKAVHVFAEIGVVLLLFVIGLELSLARLKELRRAFLLGGGVQAGTTVALAAGAALALGFATPRAVFLGCVVALSSTAIVLKLYDERRETETPHGRVSLSILLFQDFLIVPMIVLVPVLAGEVAASPSELAIRFGGGLLAVAAVFAAAFWLAPRFFERVAGTRVRETFVLGSLAACLALAWLTHSFGFSLALGAFLAGIIVSETDYGHQVAADVGPFRELFASLFFMSIGMLVDLDAAARHALPVLGLAGAVVAGKAVIVGGAVAAVGLPARTRILTALGLAQIGEFSFVLMEVGREHGLLAGDRYQVVLAAAVLTMVTTPLLMRAAPRAVALWERWRPAPGLPPEPVAGAAEGGGAAGPLADHAVIVGFGAGGRLLGRVLKETGIRHLAVELNTATVREARLAGHPMVYGDASRREVLHAAGVERARVAVFVMSDAEAVRRGVTLAREMNPGLRIVVRSRRVDEIEELRRLGADDVVAEELETAIELFSDVLEEYHVPRNVVRAQIRVLRDEGYRLLRGVPVGRGVGEAALDALAAGTTDVFRVAPGDPAAGRTLAELDVRHETGATVLAVVRGERPQPNPGPETLLEAGDDLVLVGSHAEIDRAFDLLAGRLSGKG